MRFSPRPTFVLAMALVAIAGAGCSSASSSSSSSETSAGPDAGGVDAPASDLDGGGSSGSSADGGDAGLPVGYTNVVIDFDDLSKSTAVSNQYGAHATFSSNGTDGSPATMTGPNVGQSVPNFLCTTNCKGPYFIDFAAPVEKVKLHAIGVSYTGTIAHVKVYVSGSLASTVDIVGKGDNYTPVPVDLSSLSKVTRVEVADVTDGAGIGIDDLAFDFPSN